MNAAVEGALAAGVTDVLVDDGHGPWGLHYETLHPAARIFQGGPRGPAQKQGKVYREYNWTSLVGQHAMEGTADGNLNYTQSSRTVEYYKLNGKYIGEIAQWALFTDI